MLMPAMAHVLLGTGLAAGVCWAAWCVVVAAPSRLMPASVRVAATVLTGLWLLVATFELLSAAHLFIVSVAVPLWIAGAIAAHVASRRRGRRPWTQLAADATTAARVFRGLGGLRWPLALAGLVLGLHVLRGLIAPPLAWDDLTYHLFRAAEWVQAGQRLIAPAPNAWGYAQYFPPAGDVLWAWALLPARGDAFLVFANLFVTLGIASGTYAAARWFGAPPRISVLAAGTIAIAPPVLAYLPSGYVEPTTLALFVMSVVFLARAWSDHAAADLVLASAALGLAAGVKVSNLAFAAPGLLLTLLALRKVDVRPRGKARVGAACVAAAAVCAPFFVHTWIATGSPSYPVPLTIAGITIFDGSPWQQQIFNAPIAGAPDDSWWHLLSVLFVPTAGDFADRGQFLNPGPGALVLALGLVAGTRGRWWRVRRHRVAGLYVAVAAVLVLLSALQPDVVNLRTAFGASLGRFLLVPLTVLVLAVATAPSAPSAARWLSVALVANAALAVPLEWSAPDRLALRALVTHALPLLLCAGVGAAYLARARRAAAATALACVGVLAVVATVLPVRDTVRDGDWQAAAAGEVFSPSRDVEVLARDWPLWQEVDQPRPLTIAVAAGWDQMSPLGARYPLLGRRLQNRVVYVPITASGVVCDDPDCYGSAEEGDFRAWLTRLQQEHVDVLVVLSASVEGLWAEQHRQIFVPDTPPGVVGKALYRVNAPAAAAWLSGVPGAAGWTRGGRISR